MGLFGKKENTVRTLPRHIAIVMDGNGRWAKKRGLPRTAGHAAGAETFRRIATATVSLYTPVRICHMRDGAFRHAQGYGTLAVPMFHCSEGCSHGLRFLPRYRCDL